MTRKAIPPSSINIHTQQFTGKTAERTGQRGSRRNTQSYGDLVRCSFQYGAIPLKMVYKRWLQHLKCTPSSQIFVPFSVAVLVLFIGQQKLYILWHKALPMQIILLLVSHLLFLCCNHTKQKCKRFMKASYAPLSGQFIVCFVSVLLFFPCLCMLLSPRKYNANWLASWPS